MIMPITLQQAKDEIVMLNWLKDADRQYYNEQFYARVPEEDIKELLKLRHIPQVKPIIRAKLFIKQELVERNMRKQEEGARQIAIKKIMRNKLYYCGLAKKLSMRDCGMY